MAILSRKNKKQQSPQPLKQYRIYKSQATNTPIEQHKGSIYQEPINPKKSSEGWIRNSGTGPEKLQQARYVSNKIASDFGFAYAAAKKNKRKKREIINQLFDSKKPFDYKGIDGRVMFVIKDHLYCSALVEKITPGADGTPEQRRKVETEDEIMKILSPEAEDSVVGAQINVE